MRHTPSCRVVLAALLCLGVLGHAAYLEDAGSVPEGEPPIPPVPRPSPPGGHPLYALIDSVSVGAPTHYRGLAIYPLERRRMPHHRGLRTLDEALANGWLEIREQDRPAVGTIRVRNRSGHRVFLMAGEILLGGKQNRIIRQDILLVPESGFVPVPVYCGEEQRWDAGVGAFKSSAGMAEPGLRRMAGKQAGQGDIWREIDGHLEAAEVPSATRDYGQLFTDRRTADELDAHVSRFRRLCGPRTVGLVAVSPRGIIGGDLFTDPTLLSRLWDKLCRSYATETLYRGGAARYHGRPWVSEAAVRRFLDGTRSSRITPAHTPGAGRAARIHGAIEGRVLAWRGDVVHASLFPGITILRKPPERPVPYHRQQPEHGEIWPSE